MLSQDGTVYRVEIPLSRYNESRELLESLDTLQESYTAAADDAARIVILKQMLDIYHDLIEIFLLERN